MTERIFVRWLIIKDGAFIEKRNIYLRIQMCCNRKEKFLLLSFCFCATVFFAQTFTQTIRGKIIDSDSKSPLIGATVVILNLDTFIGAASDINGNYRLNKVPVGRHTIKISFLGYEEVVIGNIVVGSGKEMIVPVEMHEKVYTSGEVEIVFEKDKTKANNDLVTNSARSFRSEETERYAGSRGDPSKMVANYAGVATGNDVRNDIIVRGNSPLGVLWRLEGVDIPNPNHFSNQGATGGPVSMLNNNLLGNTDFLTGAFPAEYGNKMAAVFDLKLRNGNNEKTELTTQLGFNGLEFGIEGPISKKAGSSFLFNYRYSTLEIFNALGISFGVSGIPKYQDCSFKINLPTTKAGVFSIWGLGGISTISLLDSEKDSTNWSFTSKGEDLVFATNMGAVGLSHSYFFNSKISGKLSLSASSSNFKITIDTVSTALTKFNVYKNTSIDGQYHANYTITDKINAKHLLKAGLTCTALLFNYNSRYYSKSKAQYFDELKEKNGSVLLQGFIHWQYRATEKLTLNSGLHYQNFVFNNSQAIEPRVGIKWQFFSKQSLNFSYGLHSQMQPLIYYFFKTYNSSTGIYSRSNKNLDLTRGQHFVAGYDVNINKNMRFKLEPYYQYLFDVPVQQNYKTPFSMINVGNDIEGIPLVDSLKNKGTGKNYGIELTLEKFFSNNYYYLVTLSLFDSKYKGSDTIERYTAFSNGYVLNTLGGIEIPLKSKNKILAFDVKVTYAGGGRYTPADINASIAQKEAVYIDSLAYSKRFKDYSKIDLKISYKINRKRSTQIFFVSIENILGTKNILRQIYDQSKQQLVNEYQLGLFPYGGCKIEF